MSPANLLRPGLTALFVCAAATAGLAQSPSGDPVDEAPLRFERFTTEEGLSNPTVTDIVQDRQGYLWITTNLGLNRYDGYGFKRYMPDPEDSTSITDRFLQNLMVDRQDRLWIGSPGNVVYRLDPGSEHFVRYPDFGNVHLEDQDGSLWFNGIRNSGLARMDPETEATTRYTHDPADPRSLGSNAVWTVYQDRSGVIWVGTSDGGLNRFDRETETFSRYTHDPNNPRTLISNSITVLFEDSRGTFWVGTSGDGLHTMDRATGTFTRHTYDPSDPTKLSRPYLRSHPDRGHLAAIHEDRQGVLWFGAIEGGLVRYDPSSGMVSRYERDPESLSRSGANPEGLQGSSVSSIYETHEGTLWIATWDAGLHRLKPSPQGVRHLGYAATDPGGDAAGVWAVLEAHDGADWWGTGDGLVRRDADTGLQTTYRHDPSDPSSLSADWVSALVEDRRGTLWVGTRGGGLNRFDRETETFARYRHDPASASSLTDDYVRQLFEDREGTLWVLTQGGGLHRLDPVSGRVERVFAPRTYDASFFDLLDRLDAEGRSLAALPGLRPGQNRRQAFELREETPVLITQQYYVLNDGRWGTWGQILTEDGRVVHAPRGAESVNGGGPANNRLMSVVDTLAPGRYVLLYGSIASAGPGFARWYGTPPDHPERWGIQVHSLQDRAAVDLSLDTEPSKSSGVTGDFVWSIHEDNEGTLWVGWWSGFHRLDRAADTFLSEPDIPAVRAADFRVHVDRRGIWWIGVTGRVQGGNPLIRFDPASGAHTKITTGIGLSAAGVAELVEDEDGRLWVGTENLPFFNTIGAGLGVIDDDLQMLRRFDTGRSAEDWNPTGTAHRGPSGRLYFGQRDGVLVVDPALGMDATPPRVVVTGLSVLDEPVWPDPEHPNASLALAHERNDLTFDYVGIYFRRAAETRYAYRLDGYDKQWRDAGTQRTATYTNLPPGAYTFRVRAANADGAWNEEGASLAFTIRPPWWLTLWAYLGYGLFFLGGVFAVNRVQRRRLIAREREKAREREIAQAREIERAYTQLKATQSRLVQQEKMASLGALTAGIAHEIKNPLNFVNNFAELNEELAQQLREAFARGEDPEDLLADLEQNAAVIAHHGNRANAIVQSMMQHASGGSGQRERVDLNALVSEYILLAYHGKRARVADFNVEIVRDLRADLGQVEVVPQEIGRVLLNLLSNAFDAVYTRSTQTDGAYLPTVTVTTRQVAGHIEISVSDNGPGIPEEIRNRIFEPFFTTKPTGQGTGLGLSLSYDVVTQGYGGALTVESEEGRGATFVLSLPTDSRS